MVITFKSIGIKAHIYTHIKSLYKDLLYVKSIKPEKEPIVISRASYGTGSESKSVIPSLCNFLDVKYVGANAYIGALLRHKYHYSLLLKSLGDIIPQSWFFCNINGWLSDTPPIGTEIIVKPIHLSDSKGISNHNKFRYSKEADFFIQNLSSQFDEPVILQKFIYGYEVNIPIIVVANKIISSVVGVGIGNLRNIEDRFFSSEFDFSKRFFYDFCEVSQTVTNRILNIANKIVKLLSLNGIYRIDARVDKNLNIYINDINSSPGISKNSSFNYFIKQRGITNEQLYLLMLASALN